MKWEYRVEEIMLVDLKSVADWLNAEGQKGWEVAAADTVTTTAHYSHWSGHFVILKRLIQPSP